MEKQVYLIITPRQTGNSYYPRYNVDFRLVSTKPKLVAKELAVLLTIKVPKSLFTRPNISAVMDIPDDVLIQPDKELLLNLTAEKVAEGLHLEVSEVRDGLAELLKKQEASRENHETSSE